MSEHNVDGVLVGRGALVRIKFILHYEYIYYLRVLLNRLFVIVQKVKPWLFEEIKTRRNWDISSRERFDILKKYCDYGLEYWGTDSVAGIIIF